MNNEYGERIEFELALYTDKKESIDNIINNIYIGNYPAALNISLLKNIGITHILVAGKDMVEMFPNDFIYKTISLYDSPHTNISKYFPESNTFIKSADKILVHCGAGVSRSVSLVLAYLISEYNMTYSESIKLMKSKRQIANPNTGFEKHLRKYSLELHKNF
jgi:protein-tyrosine phosphatase